MNNLSIGSVSSLQNIKQTDVFPYILALIPWVILPYSPMIASVAGLFFLIVFSSVFTKKSRVIISLCIILSASIYNGDCIPHGDYINYYRTYEKLLNNNFQALFDYGAGLEVALPLYYLILSRFLGELSSSTFIAINIFTAALLFYIWLEVYAMSHIAPKQRTLCVALSLLFFHYWFAGNVIRQLLSSVFLLYAFTEKCLKPHLIYVVIATLFHTTALGFYLLVWLLMKKPKIGMVVSLLLMLVFYFFDEIIKFLWDFPNHAIFIDTLKGKIGPYIVGSTLDGSSITARNFVLTFMLMCFTYLYVDKAHKQWRYVVLGFVVVYWGSVGVSGHFSLRIGILLLDVAFGYFIFLALRKQPFLLQFFALLVLLNLVSVKTYFGDITNTRVYWNYDIAGPFFYFLF
ncbi:hypothetical protein Hc94105_0730 [Helicobacter cinaedi]|uniref:EpsG family protein n=1 Tax=Helicobacter cinaedi TaxID=213 RepID=UPI001F325A37|nr:EpsG family protein [Helicobacter cinaedi]BDB66534.1 hypothetical protein Hc94105_0730 [Helicobacter cinaedi]